MNVDFGLSAMHRDDQAMLAHGLVMYDALEAWLRHARDGSFVVVAMNFTPVPRPGYRIGVPCTGVYGELFNSDSRHYGGSDLGNGSGLVAEPTPWMGRPASLEMALPPLAGVVLALRPG